MYHYMVHQQDIDQNQSYAKNDIKRNEWYHYGDKEYLYNMTTLMLN